MVSSASGTAKRGSLGARLRQGQQRELRTAYAPATMPSVTRGFFAVGGKRRRVCSSTCSKRLIVERRRNVDDRSHVALILSPEVVGEPLWRPGAPRSGAAARCAATMASPNYHRQGAERNSVRAPDIRHIRLDRPSRGLTTAAGMSAVRNGPAGRPIASFPTESISRSKSGAAKYAAAGVAPSVTTRHRVPALSRFGPPEPLDRWP